MSRQSDFFHRMTKYLVGADVIDAAHQLAKNESLISVIIFLKNKYKFFRPAPVRFLINFYRYLLLTSESHAIFEEPPSFIIHFCCWGESYCEKVKNYLLPSLLADGNLPAVVKKYKTILLIHCDLKTKKELATSAVIKNIKKIANVQFIIIPRALLKPYRSSIKYPKLKYFEKIITVNSNLKYSFLGGLQTQALEIALKNKCYISFLMPDFIVSADFLTQAFLNIQDKKVVLATGFRTDYQEVMENIVQFFSDKERVQLSLPAKELTELKVKHIHAAARRRIVASSTINYDPCAQLIFETPNGFIVRTFHLHPILLDCKNYNYQFKKDYYPVDNTILSQALTNDMPYEQQAYICDDATKIAFMELSDTHMYAVSTDRTVMTDYHALVGMIRLMIASVPHVYDTPLNHYFCSARIKFESPDIYKTGDFITDEEFFSDLI